MSKTQYNSEILQEEIHSSFFYNEKDYQIVIRLPSIEYSIPS